MPTILKFQSKRDKGLGERAAASPEPLPRPAEIIVFPHMSIAGLRQIATAMREGREQHEVV